jgi:DNA polymerase III delta prime subunit
MFHIKYTPEKLDEFKLNQGLVKTVKNMIYDNEIMNTCIYGTNGVGKFTTAKTALRELYGPGIYNTNEKNFKFKTKEITLLSSQYHFELKLNQYTFTDKSSFIELIKYFCESYNVHTNNYQIILIKNAHYLTYESTLSLKKLSEKYNKTIRFIITSNSITKIRSSLTNFIYIRIPIETITNSVNYYQSICENEKITMNYDLETIIRDNKFNIKKILLELETIHVSGKRFNVEIDNLFSKLFHLMGHFKMVEFPKLREIMYNIITRNIEKNEIFTRFIDQYIYSKNIISIITRFQHRTCDTYKVIMHIESMIVMIIHNIQSSSSLKK